MDGGNVVIKSDFNSLGNNNEEKEKKMVEKLKDVANSIHESISVKVDYPSNHENQRLPILNPDVDLRG